MVLYQDIHPILERFTHRHHLKFIEYDDFCEFQRIGSGGSGGYGTIYSAKCKEPSLQQYEHVTLKCFKRFKQMPELFISEVSNIIHVAASFFLL